MNEVKAAALVADLMGMAYGQAENVLVKLHTEHKALIPTFLVMSGTKVEIFACPWQNDDQKHMAQDLIRARMKAQKSNAYSFVSEAWMLVGDRDDFEPQRGSAEGADEFGVTSGTYGDGGIRLFVADLKKHMPPEGGVQ